MANMRRCMGCLSTIQPDIAVCPYCGTSADFEQSSPFLPVGTVISERYIVGKAISVCRDSVVYIALDNLHNKAVDLHEFLPLNIVKRGGADMSIRVKTDSMDLYYECMQSFVLLWRTLMRVHKGSAIAAVTDLITGENLTAYSVTEHIDGVTLDEYVRSQSLSGRLTWGRVKDLFMPILPTLEAIDSLNIIHRAISPQSLIVSNDGRLIISGFCIEQFCKKESSELFMFDGYSPLEMYGGEHKQGPWTDVYEITAVMYNTLTGLVPPKAQDRVIKDQLMIQQDVANALPSYVIRALFNGLRILPQDRLQSVAALVEILTPPKVSESVPVASAKPETDDGEHTSEIILDNDDENSPTPPPLPLKSRKTHSGLTLFISAVITFLVFAVAFLALYPTIIYRYISIEPLDEVYTSFAFLPMNVSEAVNETTSESHISSSTYVKVADFEKLSYSSVLQNTVFNSKYKLEYEFVNNALAKDVIIRQSIPSGSEVLQGTVITLTVSLGPKQVILPNVIKMSYDEAYEVLNELGFSVERKELNNYGSGNEDEVYSVSPVAGIEYDYGSSVTLSVWGKKTTSPSESETKTETTTKAEAITKTETTTKAETTTKTEATVKS